MSRAGRGRRAAARTRNLYFQGKKRLTATLWPGTVNCLRARQCNDFTPPPLLTLLMQPGPIRLAVIDSDSGFVRVLVKRMEGMSWHFQTFSAPVPTEQLVAMRLNALVVDPALLGPGAEEFIEGIAGEVPGLGVIVCSTRSTVAQRVRALRLGADDWVSKPCHPEEVVARIESVVRRRRRAVSRPDSGRMLAGELEVHPDQYQAVVAGRSLNLTRRQFELIQLLVEAHGQVLQREEIYQRVWGYAMAHGDRSVDVFVRKLRQALEAHSPRWEYIHTHFGIGYRLEPRLKAEHVQSPEPAPGRPPEAREQQVPVAVPPPLDLMTST
ncbi:MAG: hypothetical protein NVSMB25_14580 [Thermoleophilaceae bacterium]